MEGFMTLADDPFSVYECVDATRCSSDRQIGSAEMCSAGFDTTLPRCARCSDGMYLDVYGSCVQCEDSVDFYLKSAAAFIIQFLTALYMYNRFNRPNPSGAITFGAAVTFLQTLQAISRLDIEWPTTLVRFFSIVNVLTLPEIGALFQFKTECWTGNSVFWEVATQALSPLTVFFDFFLLHGLSRLFFDGLHFDFVHNIIGLVFTKMNISVIGLSLALFYRETMPNGKIMVKAFPELEFGGADWWAVMPLNLLTSCFYGVTLFSYVCWIVWTAPRRSMTVPGFGARYRFCFGAVRPDRFWWIIVQLTYGTVINLTQIVFPAKNVHSQVYFLLLTLVFLSIFEFRAWPLKFNDNNWVDLTFRLSVVVFLIMATSWIDTSTMNEVEIEEAEVVYSVIIMIGFTFAGAFALYHIFRWLLSLCHPTGTSQRHLTQTVWKLRDVSTAMLMMTPEQLTNSLTKMGEHDLDVLRDASTTMIHVFLGRQVSLHRRRQQRVMMGGGFRAWDHNATVLKLLKDAESGALERRVLHGYRLRLSLLKLSRAALAADGEPSSPEEGERFSQRLSRALRPAEVAGGCPDVLKTHHDQLTEICPVVLRGSSTEECSTSLSFVAKGSSLPGPGRPPSGPGASSSRSITTVSTALPSDIGRVRDLRGCALSREAFVEMIGNQFGYLNLHTDYVNEMFSCMDADNSGTVTASEFTIFMMANGPHDLANKLSEDTALAWAAAADDADPRVMEEGMHPQKLLAVVPGLFQPSSPRPRQDTAPERWAYKRGQSQHACFEG
jgi:hypothetical protein